MKKRKAVEVLKQAVDLLNIYYCQDKCYCDGSGNKCVNCITAQVLQEAYDAIDCLKVPSTKVDV